MNDPLKLLESYQQLIITSLEKILPREYSKDSLEQTVGNVRFELDYKAINLSINKPFWDLLDRGGKRWRPALFLIILEALGKNPKEYLSLASIFEFIHNATLLIDDIEDGSLKRRGKKAIHLLYGEDIAINAGNQLYYLPLKVIDSFKDILDQQTRLKIYKTYIDEMINLGFGQGTDIAWHKGLVDDFKISESKYLQMCAFKTGCLSRMASKIAAIVGGASDELILAFGSLGESLGVVFQIQDDILNITENELSAKKGLGEDITEGKRSLLVIYAFESLEKKKAIRLRQILNMHTKNKNLINEAISLIEESGALKKARSTMARLFKEAWESLEPLLKESEGKQKLYTIAHFLVDRQR